MWTTLVLAAALGLTPGQSNQLSFHNVRSVLLLFGPERQTNKFLPGDVFMLVFDIEGLKADGNGKMLYRLARQVTDSKGKLVWGEEPQDREAPGGVFVYLGGNRVPSTAPVEIRMDQPPGEYTLTVTVTDRVSKASKKLDAKFEVLPKGFGIVQLVTAITYAFPPNTIVVSPSGVVGEYRILDAAIVGFERDSVKKQPSVVVEMRILDESGKQVSKPASQEFNQDVPETLTLLPVQFPLFLNRPGNFTVELQATDRINKKTAKVSFPLTSVEQKSSGNTK
jgi:hypothetical protein